MPPPSVRPAGSEDDECDEHYEKDDDDGDTDGEIAATDVITTARTFEGLGRFAVEDGAQSLRGL